MNLFPIRFVTVGKIHGGYVPITYNSYVEIFFRYLKTFKIVLNIFSLKFERLGAKNVHIMDVYLK